MMKKILFFLLLAVFSLGISAQAPSKKCPVCGLSIPKCQYKGKHPKKKPTTTAPAKQQPSKPTKPAAKPRPTTGTLNGYDWVDLGLSVKWATQNVGASSPSDYGGYYAWGETRTKDNYDWETCFDCLDDEGNSWGTYKIGGKTRIAPSSGHDTARENWGSTWRMPTITEFEELCNKCTWTWTSQGGHEGYKVTGPNGNSIFLPAADWRYGTVRDGGGEYGHYWSSTLSSSSSLIARGLNFDSSYRYTADVINLRSYGRSVRPVTD